METFAAALTGHSPLAALLVPLFFFLSFFGSMRPNATAIALTNQGAIAGTASAWVGALPFLLGAFLSPLAGLGGEGAASVAGVMLAAFCLAGLPCALLIARRPQELTFRKRRSPVRRRPPLAGWSL
jgi:MFS transporter, DHA1 family, multidrug resistance protein